MDDSFSQPLDRAQHSSGELLLGIDGGGTKTIAWLATWAPNQEPAVIGKGSGGPSNPRAVGVQAAGRNIQIAIRGAFSDSQRTPAPVASACLALAGVGYEPMRQAMLKWGIQQSLANRVLVVNDAEAVLRAGTPEGWGIALIAGTGSFSFGLTAEGTRDRSGGWGYLFGDEGSGYAIGIAGLKAVTRAADLRGPETAITDAILRQLDLEKPSDLVPALCLPKPDRHQISSLAPLVLQAAAEGDSAAEEILFCAARELSELVVAVARKLSFEPGEYSLAMAGGVLVSHAELQQEIANQLQDVCLAPRTTRAVLVPAEGAVLLAAAHL